MVLETGTQRNVLLYKRLGFHVVEEADSPEDFEPSGCHAASDAVASVMC
jgi:hypothetical protein